MNIFESLENLQISEECFNDIMEIVESVLNEEDLDREAEEAEKKLADYIQRLKDKKIGLDLKRRKLQINREKLENIFGNKEATEQAASNHADAQIKKGLSESCFNDIMGIVEEILGEDIRSYAKKLGKLDKTLDTKIISNQYKELVDAAKREGNGDLNKEYNKIYDKRNPNNTKAGRQDALRLISKINKEVHKKNPDGDYQYY